MLQPRRTRTKAFPHYAGSPRELVVTTGRVRQWSVLYLSVRKF